MPERNPLNLTRRDLFRIAAFNTANAADLGSALLVVRNGNFSKAEQNPVAKKVVEKAGWVGLVALKGFAAATGNTFYLYARWRSRGEDYPWLRWTMSIATGLVTYGAGTNIAALTHKISQSE